MVIYSVSFSLLYLFFFSNRSLLLSVHLVLSFLARKHRFTNRNMAFFTLFFWGKKRLYFMVVEHQIMVFIKYGSLPSPRQLDSKEAKKKIIYKILLVLRLPRHFFPCAAPHHPVIPMPFVF